MRSLLGSIVVAMLFGAIGDAQAQTTNCTSSVIGNQIYTNCYGGGSPSPGFTSYPALQVRPPDIYGAFQRGQRDAEALRTQRLQNQLLQQQLQQQQQQFQATQPGVLKGDPLNADEAFIQATAAPIGKTIAWNNRNTGNYGTVTPVREGTKASTGEYCREFRRTIGGTKQGYAVACRQGDGVWRKK